MIRIFIVSPSVAVRVGLRSLLEDELRIQITGEAGHLDIFEIWHGEVDVVVWSPALTIDHEILLQSLDKIKNKITTAILLVYDDPYVIDGLIKLKLHAWGMIPPESSQAELISAVEAVNEGLVVTNPLWLQQLSISQMTDSNEKEDMVESLTGRETEILQLLALGLTNKQIALKLKISTHTVKFHVSSIFGKMQTTNRTETVKWGLKRGIISL